MQHPQIDESFLQLESKVEEVMSLLNVIANRNKKEDEETSDDGTTKKTSLKGTEDSFMVTVRGIKPSVGSNASSKKLNNEDTNVDQFTFMRQVEMDQAGRSKARLEREQVAQNFRKVGNVEYGKGNYDMATNLYSKAIDNIKDSPILYINRALCYIKLSNFKRAIVDCDFVLNKLDEKNLRAWLYRGAAYKGMNDDSNFDNCIKFARKYNSKQMEFVDNFLKKLEAESS